MNSTLARGTLAGVVALAMLTRLIVLMRRFRATKGLKLEQGAA